MLRQSLDYANVGLGQAEKKGQVGDLLAHGACDRTIKEPTFPNAIGDGPRVADHVRCV